MINFLIKLERGFFNWISRQGRYAGRGNGEGPLGGASLDANPPPQIGLILHGHLCKVPCIEWALIASSILSQPSEENVSVHYNSDTTKSSSTS